MSDSLSFLNRRRRCTTHPEGGSRSHRCRNMIRSAGSHRSFVQNLGHDYKIRRVGTRSRQTWHLLDHWSCLGRCWTRLAVSNDRLVARLGYRLVDLH